MESTNKSVEETPIQEDIPKVVPKGLVKMTPALRFSLIFLAAVLALLFLVVLFKPKTIPQEPNPLPSVFSIDASPISQPERQLSQFSQTPAFISFEKNIDQLRSTQESLDLTESQLTYPQVEMNVNYKKE